MKERLYILLTIILLIAVNTVQAQTQLQCNDFAKKKVLSQLDTTKYTHDGYLNTIQLEEGENFMVYKPFFKGKKYCIIVANSEKLPNPKVIVKLNDNKILHTSTGDKSIQMWEYMPKENQNLVVSVTIPVKNEQQKNTGCITIIVGYSKK